MKTATITYHDGWCEVSMDHDDMEERIRLTEAKEVMSLVLELIRQGFNIKSEWEGLPIRSSEHAEERPLTRNWHEYGNHKCIGVHGTQRLPKDVATKKQAAAWCEKMNINTIKDLQEWKRKRKCTLRGR